MLCYDELVRWVVGVATNMAQPGSELNVCFTGWNKN
jgi:hypothetical protein